MTEVTKDMKRGIAQLRKIEDRLLGGSLNPQDIRELLQRIIESSFIPDELGLRGLFVKPEFQIGAIHGLNEDRKLGIPQRAFTDLCKDPPIPTDPMTALILVPYLRDKGTTSGVYRTYKALWNAAATRHGEGWKTGSADAKHITLTKGVKHEPGLRWEIIDFGANQDGHLPDAVNPDRLPHAGILAAAFQHPMWVHLLGIEIPGVWMPGYQIEKPGYTSPYLLGSSSRELCLKPGFQTRSYDVSTPVLRKCIY